MLSGIYQLHRIAAIVLMLVAAGWLARPRAEREGAAESTQPNDGYVVRSSRQLMGTTFNLSVWAPPGRQAEAAEAIQHALDQIASLEKTISSWDPKSETSAVNRSAGGEAVAIGRDLRGLLTASLNWARQTEGAFDITVGPLADLWKRAREERVVPTQVEIDNRLAFVDFSDVNLEKGTVRLKKPGMQINFGAIGKGYAADHAAERLRCEGHEDFIIDAGGDILVCGSRGGEPWQVAIRDPRRAGYLAVGAARDCAIATSGDYEQFVVIDGVRYAHIIDPRTGRPARGIVSVTVLTQHGMDADALATALFVMGGEKGMAFVEKLKDTEALMVLEDGTTRLSTGLCLDKGRLSITSNERGIGFRTVILP